MFKERKRRRSSHRAIRKFPPSEDLPSPRGRSAGRRQSVARSIPSKQKSPISIGNEKVDVGETDGIIQVGGEAKDKKSARDVLEQHENDSVLDCTSLTSTNSHDKTLELLQGLGKAIEQVASKETLVQSTTTLLPALSICNEAPIIDEAEEEKQEIDPLELFTGESMGEMSGHVIQQDDEGKINDGSHTLTHDNPIFHKSVPRELKFPPKGRHKPPKRSYGFYPETTVGIAVALVLIFLTAMAALASIMCGVTKNCNISR